MKKGLHNAAIVTATVNLLYVVAVMIFWLCSGAAEFMLLSLPFDVAFVIVSALFLIAVCRAKGNVLAVVYWSAIIAELLVPMFLGGGSGLGFFGTLVLCAVVILVMTLLRNKLDFRVMCVVMSLAAVIMTAVELWFIIAYVPLGLGMLITVFYPWIPAAPLLPALSTMLMTAAKSSQ